MLIIGLTGGIGSGKSTVAAMFRQLGVPVIDTDVISRQLVEPGQDILEEIISAFGNTILQDGILDRGKLREIIFEHPDKRQQLENILHPKIKDEVKNQIANISYPYAVVVIPLLAEKGKYDFINRVLVVDCDEQLQLQRASERDNQDQKQIESIIKSQASRQQRLDMADDVIRNESDVYYLNQAVEELDQLYRQMADN